MSKHRPTQGFTLLEVLVLLGVLGILLAIGFMSATQWRQKLRADNFLAEMASDFNVSRTRTLATGQTRQIRLVDSRNYVVEQKATQAAPWTVLQTRTFERPILDLTTTVARNYEFSSRGFLKVVTASGQETTSSTIQALLGSGAKTLTVSALGIARRE
ncbi:prepilin-type N-terminal cleavage/methylation domain-containing protein [Deinococcus navajonensis]|uniref:Prepilin-type N-terminal cleavage/methylation domain-containing protein n=1 Tax=Deinococcus navajonensis TaxID=309884 RepID=A0ABV8XPV7_9DEIO